VQAQQRLAHVGLWRFHEEDLVEAAQAQQFGRQRVDSVRSGHKEHAASLFGYPCVESAEHAFGTTIATGR
jgi:hypothetical protein